jgi:hypothetical protein
MLFNKVSNLTRPSDPAQLCRATLRQGAVHPAAAPFLSLPLFPSPFIVSLVESYELQGLLSRWRSLAGRLVNRIQVCQLGLHGGHPSGRLGGIKLFNSCYLHLH